MSVKKIRGNVYAILRIEKPRHAHSPLLERVTVTRVVPDLATAKAEVARLNAVNASKACEYVWQATRLADSLPDDLDQQDE